MDPNETLNYVRQLVQELTGRPMTDDNVITAAWALANAINDLDEWLTDGEPPPAAWQPAWQH